MRNHVVSTRSTLVMTLLALATGLGLAGVAHGTTLISNMVVSSRTDAGLTVGNEFVVTNPMGISVTSLGIFDFGQDGLAVSHQVGIWNNVGTLLASITVPSGTGGTLVGNWRYIDLTTPLTLAAGSTNRLGASVGTDTWGNERLPSGVGAGVSIYGANYGSGVFVFPNNVVTTDGKSYLGPNMIYTVIPEPSILLSLGAGFAFLVALRPPSLRTWGARRRNAA